MAMIEISHLNFTYEGSPAPVFQDVSLRLDTRWKLGFIGRNGRGKTTFLQLLMGRYAYGGEIVSPVDFDYFPFEPAKAGTAMEGALSVCPEAEAWQLYRELDKLELSDAVLERPLATLSPGERTRLMLAALFLKENFLLIDEPTNHLDMEARRAVSRYLSGKSGFILVSHDRTFLDGCVDHVLSINRADIEMQKGNFSSWAENRRRQDGYELERQAALQKDIRELTASARRAAGWSGRAEGQKRATDEGRPDRGFEGHKAAKLMKRAKAIEKRREAALTEKRSLLRNLETAESLKLTGLPYPKNRLAEARDLAVRYGGRAIMKPVTFEVNRGERVALLGRNGAGKSSLLKLLLGGELDHQGELLQGRMVISHVPQEAEFLAGSLRDYARAEGVDLTLLLTLLRKLDFSRDQFELPMQALSAGQKKKVLLAASLARPAHLYLWDEPMNYVDVISRMQLEKLLLDSSATLVFVEHDAAFVDRVATKKIALDKPEGWS
ncbi:ribosomal protection-like ABC-F family protein [Gehongia tenuis]|uniref:ABC-F family ATP-binding cassette domain-containing protein n=1 Tax=Gehongia tenuis TaxID=2763655 RepID=A0A926HNC9_9FIRM|nr:ATP-binding cassette domain-containing protein [Gehongia tenuis]MBC8530464.1 ABC-F family ATP-binding cassette domain-containing protein [Gehongia tenuis]